MKRHALFGLLVLTISFFSINTYSFASTIVPNFTYSESWGEKVIRYAEEGDVWYEEIESGKFKIKVTIPATGISVDQIDADTEFYVEIGDFTGYSFRVGDDPQYQPGHTSAKVAMQEYNDNDKLVTYLKASFKWSATKLTIAINGFTPAFISPPLAYYYAADYGGTPGPIQESRDALATITIQGIPVDQPFSVALTGTSSVKPVIKQEEAYDLCKVKLKGTGQ
jgi:hypothetical protein